MFKIIDVKRGIDKIQTLLDYLHNKKAFICGGYARFCASPSLKPVPATDVDIYCENEETYEQIKKDFQELGLSIRFENDLAITYLKQKEGIYQDCPILQLIKPLKEGAILTIGTKEEILNNFDFTVIRCAIVENEDKIRALVDEDFEEDEKNKFLRIRKIHCPISSLLRFMKYARKGYYTRPMQVLKLFADWENRTEDYRERIIEKLNLLEQNGELTQQEIDELEALMRID